MADCERPHDGLLDEPVNAFSSVAYVAAGVWVWRHDRVQGGALVAAGVGSIAYHGFGGTAAHVLHDATILVLLGVVARSTPRIWYGVREQPALGACALGAFAVALPLQAWGRTGGPLCRPDSVFQAHAAWHVLTAVGLTCAFVAAQGGRAARMRRPRTPGSTPAT
jgi:predicted membrane channel-forming protein YqfA (hemolysin III family)